jgi:hypothetical protein
VLAPTLATWCLRVRRAQTRVSRECGEECAKGRRDGSQLQPGACTFHGVLVDERLHHESSGEDADDAHHVDLRVSTPSAGQCAGEKAGEWTHTRAGQCVGTLVGHTGSPSVPGTHPEREPVRTGVQVLGSACVGRSTGVSQRQHGTQDAEFVSKLLTGKSGGGERAPGSGAWADADVPMSAASTTTHLREHAGQRVTGCVACASRCCVRRRSSASYRALLPLPPASQPLELCVCSAPGGCSDVPDGVDGHEGDHRQRQVVAADVPSPAKRLHGRHGCCRSGKPPPAGGCLCGGV